MVLALRARRTDGSLSKRRCQKSHTIDSMVYDVLGTIPYRRYHTNLPAVRGQEQGHWIGSNSTSMGQTSSLEVAPVEETADARIKLAPELAREW